MPEVFIGIGSNADPLPALRAAHSALVQAFGATRLSSVYRSPAVGPPAADYLNMVAVCVATVSAAAVQATLRAIESAGGRRRTDPTVCALDLDLLLYGSCVDAERQLPRPRLFDQPFVLAPLAELAADLRHPVTGERCAAALRRRAPAVERLGGLD